MKTFVFRVGNVAKVAARDRVNQSVVYDEVTEGSARAKAGKPDEESRPFGLLRINTRTAAVNPRAEPLHVLRCTYDTDTDALQRRSEAAVERPMFCEAVSDVDMA